MDCTATENYEIDFDDNGLQHATALASWQEIASSDGSSQNNTEECQVSHCEAIPIGRNAEESTDVESGDRKFYKAVTLANECEEILFEFPPQTVGLINDEEGRQLEPEDQIEPKRRKGQKNSLEVPGCNIIKKEVVENVGSRRRPTIRGEVEIRGSKFRSERSAKDGGCLKSIKDLDIHSSLAYFWAIIWTKISCQFSASLAIGILLLMPTVGVGGDLTSVPVNTLVVVGNTARINCSTDKNQPVYWAQTLAGSGVEQWFYYGADGFHSNNADERFRIDMNEATGRYDLIIVDVKQKDAGQYACVDQSGLGAKASAELVVSDSINCKSHIPSDGVMSDNVFHIKQDVIQIACSLTYTGNKSPNLDWSWPSSDVQSDEIDVSTAKSVVSSTLKLSPSKEHNNVKLQCRATIKGATQHTIDSGLLWESETVIVKYAAFEAEEKDACPGVELNLVCNPQCSYSFERRTDHKCRCLYTYYDKSTNQNYQVASYSVRCGNDSGSLRFVLIAVAVVIAILAATFATLFYMYFLKTRKTIRHSDKPESCQIRIFGESGKAGKAFLEAVSI